MKKPLRIVVAVLATMTSLCAQESPETAYCEGRMPMNSCDPATTKTNSAKNRYAKDPAVRAHEPVDVFLESPCFTVGAEFTALFMKASGSSLHYAAEAIPFPIQTPSWEIYEVNPGYKFGFDAGIGWMFHSLNTNLSANWTRVYSNSSASMEVPLASDMVGPFFSIGPDANFFKQASAHAAFHFDEVSLDYGTYIHFGNRLHTNLFAGLAYTRIKQTLTSTYASADSSIILSVDTPSTFIGGGPQLGLDFAYRIVKGLHLTGDVAFDLLTGSLRNHTDYSTTSPLLATLGLPNPNFQSTTVPDRLQVVPGIESRLGFAYSVAFGKHYVIDLEAGYETKIYMNAVQSTDMGSQVTTETVVTTGAGVYARTFQRTLSNFALSGPYATLAFGF